MRRFFLPLLAGAVLLAPACVMTTTQTRMMDEAPPGPRAVRQGRVEWIRQTVRQTQGNPAAGAAAGAVVGGLLGGLITGHRFGALFGATTGAMIGANASQGSAEDTTYDVAVRFRNGETQIFQYRGYPPFRSGQPVTLTERGLVPAGAFAVSPPYREAPESASSESQAGVTESPVQPSEPEPGSFPPAPPAVAPATPVSGAQVQQAGVPSGQWVFTDQYGWVWMPYSPAYTFTPDYRRGDPYMFVYYPSAGWTWVYAPWLWGWGPMPYVGGSLGVRFEWYGHGWGRGWRGDRPADFRGRMR